MKRSEPHGTAAEVRMPDPSLLLAPGVANLGASLYFYRMLPDAAPPTGAVAAGAAMLR